MSIAYKKIFTFIFRPPMWVHLTELLTVFGIESLFDVINRNRSEIISNNLKYNNNKNNINKNLYSNIGKEV